MTWPISSTEPEETMAKPGSNGNGATAIHVSLQGKGGVGKSLVASILAQYFLSKGRLVRAVDTDPVNQTLWQYASLKVDRLELLRDGTVDQRKFDGLMERFLNETGIFVVDTGASTFIPFWHYILENDALGFLRRAGREVYVHTVITGGQALADTLSGFNQLGESAEERNLIVWLNEFFGLVQLEGASFADMAVYKRHQDKVLGSVAITRRNQDTFGRDVEEMIARKATFSEAISGADFSIMAKQRLRVVQQDLFEQLDALAMT
jgi:hypothetical protein